MLELPCWELIDAIGPGKPTEFGKMVKLQEAENQIVTDYEVYDRRPNDADLLIAAVETHHARLGRIPRLVAADAAFYSAKNEAAAKAKGVKRVCIPIRSTKSPERRREQKKLWFRQGQKWRTGCEGRISVVKRRWQSRQAHRSAPAILRPADPVGHSDGPRFVSRRWSKFMKPPILRRKVASCGASIRCPRIDRGD
jgi:transposase, IS5 family